MQYRKIPKNGDKFSIIGLGLGNIHSSSEEDIIDTINYSLNQGINVYDLVFGRLDLYKLFFELVENKQEDIFTLLHFGAVYPDNEYGSSLDLATIKKSTKKILKNSNVPYVNYGCIHCIDEIDDFNNLLNNGVLDYVLSLKEEGIVKHLCFSTHTPSIAIKFLELGIFDLAMFSINPVYDYHKGADHYGGIKERQELYKKAFCQNVGIINMKTFAGGQLLNKELSSLNIKLNPSQCIQYVLDRPAVVSCLTGAVNVNELKQSIHYLNASKTEKDYSILSKTTPKAAMNNCVYCNHCLPCSESIDIGLVNKYYDLANVGDELAKDHYYNLSKNAKDCNQCNMCSKRCPFNVNQSERMVKIKEYFFNGKLLDESK